MKLFWDDCFNRLMGNEGGYVNNPRDPGGETNWGISKRSYPNVDIKNLTREGAKEIYKRDFWDRINASSLYDGVVFQLFDFAVNSGVETAIRYLQRAIGVADDGHWGPISETAAHNMSESDIIMKLCSERLDFMTRLNNWDENSRGWARRIAKDLRYGAIDS